MLANRNIVCVSSIDWHFLWQTHQAIMSEFARHGNRVLFIENTGVRRPRTSDWPRLVHRMKQWGAARGKHRAVEPNIDLLSPLTLPFPYLRLAQAVNRRLVIGPVRKWLDRLPGQRPVLFSFLPTQLTLDLMATLDPDVSVYYCAADFEHTSPDAARITSYESRVIEQSDLVFVNAHSLWSKFRDRNARVHLSRIGVSRDLFERAWSGEGDIPHDLADLPRPMAGYVGGLHRYLDLDLIVALSERLPEWSFVFVGPIQSPMDKLRHRPNVHLLGSRTHADLPGYIRRFDVGLIPYVVDEFTRSAAPAKLNEYLALGKPVVSSILPEVVRFIEENGEVARLAMGPEQFTRALLDVVTDDDPERRSWRREVASRHCWSHKVAEMSRLIEDCLPQNSTMTERRR